MSDKEWFENYDKAPESFYTNAAYLFRDEIRKGDDQMSEVKHTPTPWKVVPHIGTRLPDKIFMIVGASEVVCGDDGICVPDNMNDRSFVEDEANMHHIVKCVNMHDELVEALEEVKEYLEGFLRTGNDQHLTIINEALKKAGAL